MTRLIYVRKKKQAGNVVALSYQDTDSSGTDLDEYTFTDMGIGAAASDRIVLACIFTAGLVNISGVTIGGSAATQLVIASNGNNPIAIYARAVPSGTTATVVVSLDTSAARCGCHTYKMTGGSITPDDTASSTTDPHDLTISCPANGAILGAALNNSTTPGGIDWTNLTENQEDTVETNSKFSSASDTFSSAQTDLAVEADAQPTVTATRGVAVGLAPA